MSYPTLPINIGKDNSTDRSFNENCSLDLLSGQVFSLLPKQVRDPFEKTFRASTGIIIRSTRHLLSIRDFDNEEIVKSCGRFFGNRYWAQAKKYLQLRFQGNQNRMCGAALAFFGSFLGNAKKNEHSLLYLNQN